MKAFISSLYKWLDLADAFYNPDKRILGKWQLYEYYTEPENSLLHYNAGQLKQDKLFMHIEFAENGNVIVNSNIPTPVIFNNENNLEWRRNRNFITIGNLNDAAGSIEFQFAFQNNHLRLLNKDNSGRIGFFGFFTQPQTSKNS